MEFRLENFEKVAKSFGLKINRAMEIIQHVNVMLLSGESGEEVVKEIREKYEGDELGFAMYVFGMLIGFLGSIVISEMMAESVDNSGMYG